MTAQSFMSERPDPDRFTPDPRFRELLEMHCDGVLPPGDLSELESLLLDNRPAQTFFLAYMHQHAQLQWQVRGAAHFQSQVHGGTQPGRAGSARSGSAVPGPALSAPLTDPALRGSAPAGLAMPVLTPPKRLLGYFSHPARFSVLFATITIVSFLITFAQIPLITSAPSGVTAESFRPAIVARLAVANCRWTTPRSGVGSQLTEGESLDIASGIAEVRFSNQTRLVLQGPVQVRLGRDGVKMDHGRLTAHVPSAGAGFTVETPTARIVDLGTEFGVYTDTQGATEVHVFRGRVVAQSSTDDAAGSLPIPLMVNQAARIARDSRVTRIAADMGRFVRNTPAARQVRFSLADVVQGGNGFGAGGTGGAIDVSTGALVQPPIPQPGTVIPADRSYSPVALPTIDGVFIPRGGGADVITSAGHTFDGFPPTDGQTWNHLEVFPDHLGSLLRVGATDVDFRAPGRTMIGLHANRGITFDLDQIRQTTRLRVARFTAFAGNGSVGRADWWVLLDGAPVAHRTGIVAGEQATVLDIQLTDNQRFLTLVGTDAGDGYTQDQILFGDPQLVLLSGYSHDTDYSQDTSYSRDMGEMHGKSAE